MKWLSFVLSGLLTVALVAGGGCKGEKKTAEGEGGKKLSVKAPANTSVKQGESTSVTVDITREKFNDPVDVKFVGLPDGVTVVESDMTVPKDASSAKFTLKAAPDAKVVEDQKIGVIASASGMKTPESTFKLTVKKGADSEKKLTLKAPGHATVKQGETTPITVDITRDKFNDPVELKFSHLPEGVTVVEKDLTIAKDTTSAKLNLQASPDAKLVDDHKVTVTASGSGLTQEATFNVSVKKKS